MRSGRPTQRHAGFAYVLLLIGVAVTGLVASASLSLGATMARRDAERELLFVGLAYEQALRSYAGVAHAGGANVGGRGPQTLDDLLRDPRVPGIRRHLRQRYADPLTGKDQWGLVTDASGGIVGIYSLAEGRPIQQSGFDPRMAHLEAADSYRQWVFGLPAAQVPGGTAGAARGENLK